MQALIALDIAEKIEQSREAARTILQGRYDDRMAEYKTILLQVMKKKKLGAVEAALDMIQILNEKSPHPDVGALMVLAALGEHILK